jgi:hypothetical protein
MSEKIWLIRSDFGSNTSGGSKIPEAPGGQGSLRLGLKLGVNPTKL